jgi:type II secretory pathway component PulF
MPVYQYAARSADGRIVSGTAEAGDQSSVIRMLREKGLSRRKSASGGEQGRGEKKAPSKARVKLDDLSVSPSLMAVMIRAAFPLIEVRDIPPSNRARRNC